MGWFAQAARSIRPSRGTRWATGSSRGSTASGTRASSTATTCVDGPTAFDDALRPNQIFAVSLPESPLSAERQRRVVDVCARHLLTSYGFRSLAPGEPKYCPRYCGDVVQPRRRLSPGHGLGVAARAVRSRALQGVSAIGRAALALLAPLADHLGGLRGREHRRGVRRRSSVPAGRVHRPSVERLGNASRVGSEVAEFVDRSRPAPIRFVLTIETQIRTRFAFWFGPGARSSALSATSSAASARRSRASDRRSARRVDIEPERQSLAAARAAGHRGEAAEPALRSVHART